MKKIFLSLAGLLVLFGGCAVVPSLTPNESSQKVKVVTSFYPLYEIAQQVGGDYVDVKNLVPPGAEPHDYELTPKDIASVYESQILVVNGTGLEPWLDRVSPDLQKQSQTRVVDGSKIFNNLIVGDPHIWLDPVQYSQEVEAFEKTISEVDSTHKDYYHIQAQNFVQKLSAIDQQYKTGLHDCSLHEFVTNHAAFGYLAKRYNIAMIAIAGLSPDAEPSPKTIADLIGVIKQKNIKYILTESLVSPKIADTIAQEAGAKTLVMSPLEGLTDNEITQGQNYITVMQQNLKNLQIAMNCQL